MTIQINDFETWSRDFHNFVFDPVFATNVVVVDLIWFCHLLQVFARNPSIVSNIHWAKILGGGDYHIIWLLSSPHCCDWPHFVLYEHPGSIFVALMWPGQRKNNYLRHSARSSLRFRPTYLRISKWYQSVKKMCKAPKNMYIYDIQCYFMQKSPKH